MKEVTGHLTERNNKWYAVINLYDENRKRKPKWQNLHIEANRGTRREAEQRLHQILGQYNTDDLYLYDTMSHSARERSRIAHMQVIDYLPEWLESHKINISQVTYDGYKTMINSRMIPFFGKFGDLKVKDITGDEINDYYLSLHNAGLKGRTAQRHHAMLHLAFKAAVKRRIIASNPVEQADRPKAQPYIGKYYNANELRELLEKTKDDPIHLVILLAAYYGLRRSEVIGLKWSAIDFENKTISINHKVLEGKRGIEGMDVMKTKSSYRTLPLIPQVEEALLAEREKQEEMKRVMRRGYSKKYTDYVCVDAVGEIIRPDYVSDHFKIILKDNGLKQIRFHDLRHSCASLLLSSGVPMKMIQDWLGHSDMGTTANIYSHIDSESKKASALAIGTALG
ncbi:MAG: site-specific integrase [Clostridia bacterium]|nr:site-specific integrase [Clostridia bacterium]